MKHVYLSLIALLATALSLSAGENLLRNSWWGYGKSVPQATRNIKNNVMTFKNAANVINGYTCTKINMPPNKFKEIKIGCEVKAKNIDSKNLHANFCLYMDIQLSDGKMSYANQIVFDGGTYDWTKQTKTFKFPQTIKQIKFYVLFRNITGEAQVRNIFLEAIK